MTTSHDNISLFSPQELYCIDVRQCSLYFASYCFCIMFPRFQQMGWRIYDLHAQTFSTPRSNAQGFPSLYSLYLMHLVYFYCFLVSSIYFMCASCTYFVLLVPNSCFWLSVLFPGDSTEMVRRHIPMRHIPIATFTHATFTHRRHLPIASIRYDA